MYYFDNKLLAQYIDQKKKVKVFVDNSWYEIADQRDLEDPISGNGIDVYGAVHTFDFRDIQQIKVGEIVITLEMLQQQHGQQSNSEEKPKPPADDSEETPPDEEPPKKEKEPDLSWYSPMYDVGRNLIKERKMKNVR